jgi:hypothetical protein
MIAVVHRAAVSQAGTRTYPTAEVVSESTGILQPHHSAVFRLRSHAVAVTEQDQISIVLYALSISG